MRRMRLGVAAMIAAIGLGATTARADDAPALTVRVMSTSDTTDSRLWDDLLKPLYLARYPNDKVTYTGVGTGVALDNARLGLADAVVTHAPTSEQRFVDQGYSVEPYGRAIFSSDYVIVGPKSDPAGVGTAARHDAITAFERIAAAGAGGKAVFFSRADASGTNVQEELMWGGTATVPLQASTTKDAVAAQKQPVGAGGAGTYPAWYSRVKANQGINVDNTSKCVAATDDCYTMVDRGTFNYKINSGVDTNLVILSDQNTAGVRGGQDLLINPFSAYIVSPSNFSDATKPNVAAGTRFVDFLTSPEVQAAVNTYPTASDPAFLADATPKVDGSVPQTATGGSSPAIAATFTDKLPGGGAVKDLPVTLQASTDGGATFTDVGSATTAADGTVSFSPRITSTTTYRVTHARFQKFSPGTTTLGVVAVPVAAQAQPPAATPSPAPAKVADTLAPKLTKARLTGRILTLTTTEAGRITVTVARKSVRKIRKKGSRRATTRTSYATAKRLTLVAKGPGAVTTTFSTLKPATYRLTITSVDAAGNARRQVVTLVLKARRSTSKTLG